MAGVTEIAKVEYFSSSAIWSLKMLISVLRDLW